MPPLVFKPLGRDNVLITPFRVHKIQTLKYTVGDGVDLFNIVPAVDFLNPNNFNPSTAVVNVDGTFQGPLFKSIEHIFYTPGEISGSVDFTAGGSAFRNFTPSGSAYVLNIPQQIFGEGILPGSFVLSSPSSSNTIVDDGLGRLVITGTSAPVIGNIFYDVGVAVIGASVEYSVLSFTNAVTGQNTGSALVYSSSVFMIPGNRLLLLTVQGTDGGSNTAPIVGSSGITWIPIISQSVTYPSPTTQNNVSVFYAINNNDVTSSLLFTWANTQSLCLWNIDAVANGDLSKFYAPNASSSIGFDPGGPIASIAGFSATGSGLTSAQNSGLADRGFSEWGNVVYSVTVLGQVSTVVSSSANTIDANPAYTALGLVTGAAGSGSNTNGTIFTAYAGFSGNTNNFAFGAGGTTMGWGSPANVANLNIGLRPRRLKYGAVSSVPITARQLLTEGDINPRSVYTSSVFQAHSGSLLMLFNSSNVVAGGVGPVVTSSNLDWNFGFDFPYTNSGSGGERRIPFVWYARPKADYTGTLTMSIVTTTIPAQTGSASFWSLTEFQGVESRDFLDVWHPSPGGRDGGGGSAVVQIFHGFATSPTGGLGGNLVYNTGSLPNTGIWMNWQVCATGEPIVIATPGFTVLGQVTGSGSSTAAGTILTAFDPNFAATPQATWSVPAQAQAQTVEIRAATVYDPITTNGLDVQLGTEFDVTLRATQTIYEHQVIATIEPSEFNASMNPSAVGTVSTGSGLNSQSIDISDLMLSGTLNPYITTIGLYTDDYQLVAVAKLPNPVSRLSKTQQSFIIRFDV